MGFFKKKAEERNSIDHVMNIVKERSIDKLRERVKILLVDDEEYEIIDVLKTRGYDIYYKSDINYLIETEPFDIVLLDIKGIAKKFGSSKQGFGFAIKVKERYPQKIVVSFSGTSDVKIYEEIDKIDGFIMKDTEVDIWCNRLDQYIKDYCDPNKQWDSIANKLRKEGVSNDIINELKDEFISSFENNSFDKFSNKFMEKVKNAKELMEVLSVLISLFKAVV